MKKRKVLFPMIRREWNHLRKNWWLKLVLLVIIFIPIIYTGLFLGSMWDPYGNTDAIPVAVVNHDKAVSYNGSKLDVGRELVENLKKNDDMKFEEADEEKANRGLKEGKYYMKISIPRNFSKNATTVLSAKPKKMVIEYTMNPGKNYIASKMDESAINKIKSTVSESVTETYAKTLFTSMNTINEGLAKAADGSGKLVDGSQKLQSGIMEYTGGVATINEGTHRLDGAMTQLFEKSNVLAKGATKLSEGGTALNKGVEEYTGGVATVNQGINQLTANNSTLKKGVADMEKGLTDLLMLSSGLSESVETMPAQIDALINQIIDNEKIPAEQKVAILKSKLGELKSSITAKSQNPAEMGLIQATKTLQGGINSAKNGSSTLKDGINQYTQGADKIKAGTEELVANSQGLKEGATQLNEGLKGLKANVPAMTVGIGQLKEGTNELKNGAEKLDANSQNVMTGIDQIKKGSATLNVALVDGAKKSEVHIDEENYNMFASPVDTEDKEISTVKNNGSAMAPYMMSVALYVAAMAFTLMYPLLKHIQKSKSGLRYWAGKASVMYPVATVAAIIMVGLLMAVNGLEPKQVGMTFAFAVLVSIAFMSMIVFFNAAFGRIGEFLMLIYMVVNLAGSAGTYPLETSAPWFKTIHPYVPFSYSVDGFRTVISMDDPSMLIGDIKVFAVMILSFAVATIIYYGYRRKNPKPLFEMAFPEE